MKFQVVETPSERRERRKLELLERAVRYKKLQLYRIKNHNSFEKD